MPNYRFHCPECSSEILANYSIEDRPDEVQCECGASAPLQIGAAGLIAGKSQLPKTERRQFKDRLAERERRIEGMDSDQGERFRALSKKITGGRF